MLHLYHISMATSFFFLKFKLDLWPLTLVHLRGFLGSEKKCRNWDHWHGTATRFTSRHFWGNLRDFLFFSPRFWSYFSFQLRRGGVDGWVKAIDALSSASTRSGISKLKQPGRDTDTGFFFDIQYSASSELGATFAAPPTPRWNS